jgi:hypothetical protein
MIAANSLVYLWFGLFGIRDDHGQQQMTLFHVKARSTPGQNPHGATKKRCEVREK